MGDPHHRRGQFPSQTTNTSAADESRLQPSSSHPMYAHSILGQVSPHSIHRSVSLGEGPAVSQPITRGRRWHARAESVNEREGSSGSAVTRSDDGGDEENDDEETLFDQPGPRYSVSDGMFREIQTRHGVITRGRRHPGPVPGQTQQERGHHMRSGQSARPGLQNLNTAPARSTEVSHAPAGQGQRQTPTVPGQGEQSRGQNTRPLPFDPHNILETWASPGSSPRVRLTQHAPGHPSGYGHGQPRRGQNTHPLPFDAHDTLGAKTWIPQSPRPRFSQAQHASGQLPSHGQAAVLGHGPLPFQFPAHEHHPGHLPVHGPGHILADRVDPVPVGTYVVRLTRSMGRSAVGIWRARADGTWSPVVNLQGGSGKVVLPP